MAVKYDTLSIFPEDILKAEKQLLPKAASPGNIRYRQA